MTIVLDLLQDVVELLGTCSGKDGESMWIILTVIERIEIYYRPCIHHIICGIFFQAERDPRLQAKGPDVFSSDHSRSVTWIWCEIRTFPKKRKATTNIEYDKWVVVSNVCYLQLYLGRWSNLTNMFQLGWNRLYVSNRSCLTRHFYNFWVIMEEGLNSINVDWWAVGTCWCFLDLLGVIFCLKLWWFFVRESADDLQYIPSLKQT